MQNTDLGYIIVPMRNGQLDFKDASPTLLDRKSAMAVADSVHRAIKEHFVVLSYDLVYSTHSMHDLVKELEGLTKKLNPEESEVKEIMNILKDIEKALKKGMN